MDNDLDIEPWVKEPKEFDKNKAFSKTEKNKQLEALNDFQEESVDQSD